MRVIRRETRWLVALVSVALATSGFTVERVLAQERPPTSTPIMGHSVLVADQLSAWYRSTGRQPRLHGVTVEELARLFVEEGAREGVRGDVAFAQSIFETDFFAFSGTVPPELHNYAGFGAPSNPNRFPDARTGVRAQIQHLRAYADPSVEETGTASPLVDPRFDRVQPKGQATTFEALSGRWAPGPTYGEKIVDIYLRIRDHAGPTLRDRPLAAPVVAGAAPGSGGGVWLVDDVGGVFALGAPFLGSVPALGAAGPPVGAVPVTAVAATPAGHGYWIVDERGGVFAFGNAPFRGSIPSLQATNPGLLAGRIVAVASTPTGDGYWLVDEHGGVFTFGDARYHGSVAALGPIGARVVAFQPTPTGDGYWLVDEHGGVFAFGDAPYHGSIPGLRAQGVGIADHRIVALAVTPTGNGYWLVDDLGGVFALGAAPFRGSGAGSGLAFVDVIRIGAGESYRLVTTDGGVIAYR